MPFLQIQSCPYCGRKLSSHRCCRLASIAVDQKNDPRLTKFLNAIKNHSWSEVLAFQEWRGACDNYEVYGIGAEHHPLLVAIVRDPVEIYDNEKIVGIEIIDDVENVELLRLAGDKGCKPLSDLYSNMKRETNEPLDFE